MFVKAILCVLLNLCDGACGLPYRVFFCFAIGANITPRVAKPYVEISVEVFLEFGQR